VYTPAEYKKEKPTENWEKVLECVKTHHWKKFMILCTGEPFPYDDDMIILPSVQ
jgi:hypothetical protein